MLQKSRERLVLFLIALLPLHAFLVTVGTKMIVGPGQSPLPMLAIWKEALLGVILVIAMVEWAMKLKMEYGKWKIDSLDICIAALLLWSVVQSIILNSQFSIFHYALGFKYDFLPLVAFLILRRVSWSVSFARTAGVVLLGVGGIVAVYGIATTFFPMSWFTTLGYSDLHSLYIPGGPLAPFQQIEASGFRRIQSTFSGPNQMGLWMLIPLSVSIMGLEAKRSFLRLSLCLLFLASVLLAFSRAAWIAAVVICAVVAWKHLPRKYLFPVGSSLLVLGVIAALAFPQIILRATSSAGHIERPLQALKMMREHPFGLGLGSAGPASNRFSDACVDLPLGSDASWAQAHPQLCVFVAGAQVQPLDRVCSCPLLPENWYLQIGVELGWIGFVLYVALVVMILLRLHQLRMKNDELKFPFFILHSSFFIFLGISIAALFLHAWEDSAVAYTVWILFAAVLIPQRNQWLCFRGPRLRPPAHD